MPKTSVTDQDKSHDTFIRVFLDVQTKTDFKVNCARENVPMSEKARQLIELWNSGKIKDSDRTTTT